MVQRRLAKFRVAHPVLTDEGFEKPVSPFGSSFDSFLEEHGILEEVHATIISDMQVMHMHIETASAEPDNLR